MAVSIFKPIVDAVDRLTISLTAGISSLHVDLTGIHGDLTAIHGDLDGITAKLAQIVVLMTPPPPATHFNVLVGGQRVMGIAIVHDDTNEMLSIQPVDDAGNPTGPLDPSVVVTWSIVTDPSPTPPSVTITPQPDNQTCKLQQNGQLVQGVVISATAQLPGQSAPETEQETFNVVASAATGFAIQVAAETHN